MTRISCPKFFEVAYDLRAFYFRNLKLTPFISFLLATAFAFGLLSCTEKNTTPQEQTDQSTVVDSIDNSSESRYLQRVQNASLEERTELLRNGHRNFLNLPIEESRVYSEILPKIEENRQVPFPDFPQRGGTPEETKSRMNDWLTHHPDRLAAYLTFLDEQYAEFERSFQYNKSKTKN